MAVYLIHCFVLFDLGWEAGREAVSSLSLGFTMRISCRALTT